jgi:hypothetical protein
MSFFLEINYLDLFFYRPPGRVCPAFEVSVSNDTQRHPQGDRGTSSNTVKKKVTRLMKSTIDLDPHFAIGELNFVVFSHKNRSFVKCYRPDLSPLFHRPGFEGLISSTSI